MTELIQTILQHYPIRKTASQKQAFIDLIRQHYPQLQLQEGGTIKSRNIIIGNVRMSPVKINKIKQDNPAKKF